MENFSVANTPIGQGSYGKVYKAVDKSNQQIVALKVIPLRGKHYKELKNIRHECQILRTLSHPNIIRMLQSFETDDDIILVTEFAPQDLSQILLIKEKLEEGLVKDLVCDLLSALHYLHYHRVLHRDLKPQNILVEANGTAKLCDFGFARSMSRDTLMVTSIKGTPLYMAPEIIKGAPYDHSADLWSLGCIVYECLVGSPPYYTHAILRLLNLHQKDVEFPNFVSPECRSFLQGLLQQDPSRRLPWPELLRHPFVDLSKISFANIPTNAAVLPLTHPLTASQALAKEKQKKDLICYVTGNPKNFTEAAKYLKQQEYKQRALRELQAHPKTRFCQPQAEVEGLAHLPADPQHTMNRGILNECRVGAEQADQTAFIATQVDNPAKIGKFVTCAGVQTEDSREDLSENCANKIEDSTVHKSFPSTSINANNDLSTKSEMESELLTDDSKSFKPGAQSLLSWISQDNSQPIECEEWLVFLQKTMEEMMEGEVVVMTQENCVEMLVAPLRNPHASSKVIEYVANLLSLPFVINDVTDEVLSRIKEVYLVVKAVPNLVYASNLLAQQRICDDDSEVEHSQSLRPISDLGADELHAMECIYLLLCHLTHISDVFLKQFLKSVVKLNRSALLQQLLHLGGRKPRIVADLLAILAHILRTLPDEKAKLVESVAFGSVQGGKAIDFSRMLASKCPLLRSRCCEFLRLLKHNSCPSLQNVWTTQLRTDLENLCRDSNDSVRESAEKAVMELKDLVCIETQSRQKR